MTDRRGAVERTTKETSVRVSVGLDGPAGAKVDTGIPFLDHMLSQLGTHATKRLPRPPYQPSR